MRVLLFTATLTGVCLLAMTSFSKDEKDRSPAEVPEAADGQSVITFGAGCFWCVEAVLQQVDGVIHATSGYMGGTTVNPTYEQVISGATGHAEVVRVVFDPEILPLKDLLGWFWQLHDPTQLNRQGNDVGTQYRSAIFFHDPAHEETIRKSMAEAQKDLARPIVTQIKAAPEFYAAEVYHQDYYSRNRNSNPYCPAVIAPKLRKLGLED